MDENNKETAQEESTASAENNDVRNKPKTTSLIDRADAASERLGKLLNREDKNLDRREALMVSDRLAGGTTVGQSPKPAEISPKDYANDVLSGKHNAKEE